MQFILNLFFCNLVIAWLPTHIRQAPWAEKHRNINHPKRRGKSKVKPCLCYTKWPHLLLHLSALSLFSSPNPPHFLFWNPRYYPSTLLLSKDSFPLHQNCNMTPQLGGGLFLGLLIPKQVLYFPYLLQLLPPSLPPFPVTTQQRMRKLKNSCFPPMIHPRNFSEFATR